LVGENKKSAPAYVMIKMSRMKATEILAFTRFCTNCSVPANPHGHAEHCVGTIAKSGLRSGRFAACADGAIRKKEKKIVRRSFFILWQLN